MGLLAAQTALLAEIRAALPATVRTVKLGPGAWDPAYFERIIEAAPAAMLAFLSGVNGAPGRPELSMQTRWAIVVVTPWEGRSRERGDEASLMLVQTLCAALHWCKPAAVDVGIIAVLEAERIWNAATDKKGRSVAAIVISVEVAIDPEDAADALNDFLRAGVDWNTAPGAGNELEEIYSVEGSQ